MKEWIEPEIIIENVRCTAGQAMTIRVALETFAMTLVEDGLGEDESGKAICAGYLRNIEEIRLLMRIYETQTKA